MTTDSWKNFHLGMIGTYVVYVDCAGLFVAQLMT